MGQNLGMMGKIPGHEERGDGQAACASRWPRVGWAGWAGMGGFPGMPGMGLPGMGFPGMGFPGMGMPGGGGPGREPDEDANHVGRREERPQGGPQAREGRPQEEPTLSFPRCSTPGVVVDKRPAMLRSQRTGVFGVACLLATVSFLGCVGGSKGLSSEDKEKLKPLTSSMRRPPTSPTSST